MWWGGAEFTSPCQARGLLMSCHPLPRAEPCRCGSVPQHLAGGDQGPSTAISVPIPGWIQALPLRPGQRQAHAVSAPGALAEGQGLTLGRAGVPPFFPSHQLVLASHGNTAIRPLGPARQRGSGEGSDCRPCCLPAV